MIRSVLETPVVRMLLRVVHALERPFPVARGGGPATRAFARDLLLVRDVLRVLPATVVDAGAARGSWTRAALAVFPRARVHACDPLPGTKECLSRLDPDGLRLSVHEVALGPRNGLCTFHHHEFADASSLLRAGPRMADLYPHAAGSRDITVPCRRLDSLEEFHGAPPVLLKLDVQGSELGVLEGCGALISSVVAVILELNFEPLYEEQASPAEVVRFLAAQGLTSFLQLRAETTPSGLPVSSDVLFLRRRIP